MEEEEGDVGGAAAELKAALLERDDYREKMMRALAEAENARTIARRDVTNAREYAVQSFAKSLLDVSDNLGYAVKAAREESASLEKLLEGVEMTRSQLLKAFGNQGIGEFGEVGDPFDPSKHEALFEYDDANSEPGTVGQVLKSGFNLRSRVLRAAQVGVVKKPQLPTESEEEQQTQTKE